MKRRLKACLSALLAAAMLLSLLPGAAFAAGETGTFTKITTQEELTNGKYVMVVDSGYAVGALDGTWLTATQVTDENGSLTNPDANLVWDITVTEDGVTLTDANGVQVAPKGGNTNGIQAGSYTWAVNFTDGAFRFLGTGSDTVTLASNKSSGNQFRAYKNTTINNGYPCDFTLYQYVEGTGSTDPDPGEDPGSEPAESPIADGDRVVIYNPTYMKALSSEKTGNYNVGTDLIILDDGKVTGYGDTDVWTVVENEDSSYSFQQDGQNIGISEGFTSLNLGAADDDWTLVALEDGTYNVKNVTRGNYLEWYAKFNNWSTYAASDPAHDDQFCLSFYVIPDTPDPDEPETIDIAEALAAEDGTEGLSVKGVVTLVDGKNVYLQDSTGGICAYFDTAPSGIALGDTIIATGKRATYNDLPELAGATYEASSGLTLTPAVKAIGDLTTADICTYVTLRNVEVTEVYDKNGEYSSPNITVTDGANSIQLYKAVIDKNTDGSWPVAVGDVITITAAVGVHKGTLQLRNTSAAEIDLDGTPAGPIAHGDQVVIYNPEYKKALSGTYGGYYNNGTDISVADGVVSGFTASDVWTVIDNGDTTWSFSYNGQKIGMGESFSSMPLGEKHDKWKLEDAGDGLYYIKNEKRGAYMEWFASKGNWSSYGTIASGSEDMFALAFYKVTDIPQPGGDLEFPETFVIYNLSAQGVLAGSDGNETSPSVNNAAAAVADGAAIPANGARVFTVEQSGEYYRFKTADGYLSSNGTGNNAFYQETANEDADWTVTAGKKGGWNLMSRTAKFNGKYDQYLEYYGGTYKTYSMYNVTDYDIYEFFFYPLAEGVTVTDGVVNAPTVSFGALPDAYAGQEYTVSFTVDAVFGVSEDGLTAKYGETTAALTEENGAYSFTIPGDAVTEGTLAVTVTGADTKGVPISGSASITVKDEPYISEVFPAANTQTGDDKTPEIGFTFGNAGENPTITLKVGDKAVTPTVAENKASYKPDTDMANGRVTVTATVTRADNQSATKSWTFTIGTAEYQLYFGQLHSHTTYSDGSGSLESALNYVAGLPESANVDFVAFTDHSNYFDASGNANPEGALYDISLMTSQSQTLWNEYKGAVADFNAEHAGELVALAGFEMTWSGGPGHINTFNTEGLVSRNNTTLNSKTSDAGLKAYYSLLSQTEGVGSISQFNHPGDTFGTFVDFAYWDAVIDTRIQLVEVGNGEGAIGAGGYYPSYEYYIMALDKGWHVAPTNNQDNHKGKWGNANDARDVILTDDFSEEGIYQAIRDRRVYATEDKNLEINYTLNDAMLGAILDDEGVEQANINVTVYDPDASDSIARVEVVVNSGAVAYTWDDPEELASGALSCTIPADYSYYFIRVTQGDGDIAVTAPVWVGETLKLGISSVTCGTANPVTDEEVTITTNLFNSETEEATVNSVTYTSRGETLYTDTTGYTIPAAGGTLAIEWKYTPTQARLTPITVTVSMTQGGMEYTYSMEVTLDVLDAEQLVYIGIDASHYNEYVNGNYKDSMGNFGNLAAGYQVRTVELATSEDLIAACENAEGKYVAIILTAPSRRDGSALRDPYVTYSQEEIQALVDFNAAGGALILAGWSDYYESYADFPAEDHMAAQQNQVLAALGSSLRIGDDATNDDERNGGQTQRLYFNTYNWDSFLVDGVDYDAEHDYDNMYTQLFSQYGGASVYVVDETGAPTAAVPDTVTPVVYGHATTYSKDSDGDGLGGDSMPKYPASEGDDRLMVLATEDLGDGKGLIIVSGAAFMSNFEVQAEVEDSGAEKNYSNYNICENLVEYLNPVAITPIADVQAQEMEGVRYTIEGVVTSNASGYDKDTAFFDCIYLQDGTAGINAFPVAGDFKIGDKVRITGTTSSYQGERQIAVTDIEKIGEGTAPAPKSITAAQLNDGSVLGNLVTLRGTVVSFEESNGLVQTILVRDSAGGIGRVFIDGYITTGRDVQNLAVGREITVTGLASYDNTFNAPEGPFPRIRVRDRADVVCTTASGGGTSGRDDDDDDDSSVVITRPGQDDTHIPDSGTLLSPGVFTDLDQDAWYYDAVSDVVEQGLMVGVSATSFAPDQQVSRSMLVTVLYRMSGETWEGGSAAFPDVEPNTWYSDAVAWASANGVVNGYDNGLFGVNGSITREQLVTMLYRFWLYLDGQTGDPASLSAFADAASVSGYAKDAMAWAVAQGLIQGRPGGLLAPAEGAGRAELCTILVRFQALSA